MAYNIKYQQKAYIIIMFIKINGNIYVISCKNDLTNNILLKMGSLLSKLWTHQFLLKTHSSLY